MTNNLERELQMVLEENEEVLWHNNQNLKATMIWSILIIIVMLFMGGFIYFLSTVGWGECEINGEPAPVEKCNKYTRYISYGIIVISLLAPIYSYLNYIVTNYVVTDKRILIKSGILGADIKSIYYDQIENIFVNVDLVGKIFGTGTVSIDTGKIEGGKSIYDKISNIESPYEVYQKIQSKLSKRKEDLYSGKAAENR